MIEHIKYFFRLKQRLFNRRKINKLYNSHIRQIPKGSEEREEINAEAMAAISEIDRQIRELHTERLLKIANKLIVPIPSFSDETAWEELSPYRKVCLTNKGIFELKKSIRLEKKERRDIVFRLITILIGLIGTLIGLISVLKN